MVGDPQSKQVWTHWRMTQKRRYRTVAASGCRSGKLRRYSDRNQREGEKLRCASDVNGGWMEKLPRCVGGSSCGTNQGLALAQV